MARTCKKFGRSKSGQKVCRSFGGTTAGKGKKGLSRTCTKYGRSKTGQKVCRKYGG